jgi:hypothetical protein
LLIYHQQTRNEGEDENIFAMQRTTAHCRLSGWLAGKGQCTEGAAG